MKESIRSLRSGGSVSKILPYFTTYLKSNRNRSVSPLDLGIPWIAFGSIFELESILRENMKVFEFGSGGSTRFFVQRVAEVHSVEHHDGWYRKVQDELGHFSNLNLYFKPGIPDISPGAVRIEDESKDGLDYFEYASSISYFSNSYFDIILIDGRARNACVANSINKLKPGGFLVLDNSNRQSYEPSLARLRPWLFGETIGPSHGSKKFTQTSIYKKPNDGI